MHFCKDHEKQTQLEYLLEQSMVMIGVDSTSAGVELPNHLMGDLQLRLNISYNFGTPLSIEQTGVLATLTFGGEPFLCRLPWHAIYLLIPNSDGPPILFPESVPPALLQDDAPTTAPTTAAKTTPTTPTTPTTVPRAQGIDVGMAMPNKYFSPPSEPNKSTDTKIPPKLTTIIGTGNSSTAAAKSSGTKSTGSKSRAHLRLIK